jgi:hypothetical protein
VDGVYIIRSESGECQGETKGQDDGHVTINLLECDFGISEH